jgi:hypothetical protein
MAWTAPRTWVALETVTAALLNTHLRDNLLETAPAKASAQADTFYATAANAIARLAKGTALQLKRMNSGATAPEWYTPGFKSVLYWGEATYPIGPADSTVLGPGQSDTSVSAIYSGGDDAGLGKIIVPFAGTVSQFYVVCFNTLTTASITFTVRKNGVDQAALVITLVGGADSGSDLTGSVSVAAGDVLSISVVASSGGTGDVERITASLQLEATQ